MAGYAISLDRVEPFDSCDKPDGNMLRTAFGLQTLAAIRGRSKPFGANLSSVCH